MGLSRLKPLTGEFHDPEQEAVFQRHRLAETMRHARLLLAMSAVLNTLFLISDWRFFGEPHFFLAVPARLVVVAGSVIAFMLAGHAADFPALQRVLIGWQWLTAVAVAVLVSSQSNIALLVVVLLPAIYYLAFPVSFLWSTVNGSACSVLLLVAYLGPSPEPRSAFGLALAVVMLNTALIIVLMRDNRLSRQGWGAMQAERRAQAVSTRSSELLEKTFMATPIPLLITEMSSGQILRYNDAGVRYFGGTPEQFELGSINDVYLKPEARDAFIAQILKHGQVTNFETQIRLGSGDIRTVLLEGTTIDIDGKPCVLSGVVDITDRLAAEQRVRHAARHDVLTGLPNRAAFQNDLEAAYATGAMISLLLVDLDSLKDVNDTFGHDAGDALLVESGKRLQALVGQAGQVARLGGDEFVVLLHGWDADAARALAQDIIVDFRRPLLYSARPLFTKASVGIAVRADGEQPPGELLKDADLALYAAKQQGRNRAVFYSPAMRQAMQERVLLHRALTDAAAHQAIVPFYQPKISLVTGRITGFEALMRWRQGPQAFLAPGAFDQAFEDPDLAVLIGDSMVRQVAADVRGWVDAGLAFGRVALNLSPAQFTHLDLGRHLLERFETAGVSPHHFDAEVTETVFLGRRADHVAPILDELYRAGMRIALDDFGTGYAALTHLKQLPIDTIKIDQSFVEDIERDPFDAAIVCSVLELGKNLGMQVVAEGVETLGQARFLHARGCEVAQGFFYARPMPAARLPGVLADECEALFAARLGELHLNS
ncbi:EAL domain-containing protein [Azorhizobium sp. AG788]|uniref:putative bifunctional diguanylate cyclase/phosphodiesterase n=1 Tax=Azorhizobium sp. AG788 TaxID=2183897 RepID=UPI00313986A8